MSVYVAPLLSALLAFAICLAAGPLTISYLHRLKVGQSVREDGPRTHLDKAGTPTMGGILIILSVVIAVIIFPPPLTHNQIIMLFATVALPRSVFFR